MTLPLLLIAAFTVAFCMVAKRLSTTVVTAPMAFIGFGYLLSFGGWMGGDQAETLLHLVAEVALVLLLFLDAAKLDLKALRREHVWPVRMLAIGLPLSIAIGALIAWPLLPGWPWVAVVLVAAILAPTDAALGQAVVTNPVVPERARSALTVESGLNDGLALPVVLLFASLTASAMAADGTHWGLFALQQLTLGPAVGIGVGYFGARALMRAKDLDLTSDLFEGIAAVGLAGAAYLGATAVGGNGFIAAFTAGLAFGGVVQGQCRFIYEFTESEGQVLSWGAFLLIGAVLMPAALTQLTPAMLAVIASSLFVVRPLAIWLSLLGTDASPATRLFFGWFGPRGLATALFALLVVAQIDHALAEPVLALAVNAVWISALLHGVSAVPGAARYAAHIGARGPCAETERVARPALPIRTRAAARRPPSPEPADQPHRRR